MPIQIILIVLFVLAILKVISRFRTHDISRGAMILWILFWLAGIAVVARPNNTFQLAHLIGVTRGVDAVIYGALTLVFFILFRLFIKIEKQQKEITILNREITLLKSDKEQRS